MSVVDVARRLSFIRETEGPNRGKWVSMLQNFCGGIAGDPWCADFVSFVLHVQYYSRPPLHRTGSTIALLADARAKALVIDAPTIGCLFFYVYEKSREPHHVGIVTALAPLIGIAGNTSEDGLSSDGTGVFEHAIATANVVFVRLP